MLFLFFHLYICWTAKLINSSKINKWWKRKYFLVSTWALLVWSLITQESIAPPPALPYLRGMCCEYYSLLYFENVACDFKDILYNAPFPKWPQILSQQHVERVSVLQPYGLITNQILLVNFNTLIISNQFIKKDFFYFSLTSFFSRDSRKAD